MDKINIIALGNAGVGKTSLLYRFLKGMFIENPTYTSFHKYVKKTDIKGQEFDVYFWDTAGQERFRSLIQSYYRVAQGVLLVYSVNDFNSCQALKSWLTDFRTFNDSAEIIVVGNMNEDPEKKSETGAKVVQQLVREERFEHVEMSAKSGENVHEALNYFIQRVLVANNILDHCNRPECVTPKRTGVQGHDKGQSVGSTGCEPKTEKTDLSKNGQIRDHQIINLVDQTPVKKSRRCC